VIALVLFSILPALQSSKTDINEALKEGASLSSGGGVRGQRSRGILVISQLALALILLVVAGLAVQSAIAVRSSDLGFDTRNLLVARLDLPQSKYPTDDALRGFCNELLPRLAALPGVTSAAVVSELPILGSEPTTRLAIQGRPAATPSDRPWAVRVVASEDYVRGIGLALLRGRGFTSQDTAETPPVALVSQEMARRYWKGGEDPIGRSIGLGETEAPERWIEIVGIVGDVHIPDAQEPTRPVIYLPHNQAPMRSFSLVLRYREDSPGPRHLAGAVRREIRGLDPDQAVYDLKTLKQAFHEELASDRIILGLFTSFAVIALLMAAAGIYAVISYSVSQRSHEIGIRMALGATASNIRGLVVGQGIKLTAIGAAIGLAGGLLIARTMKSLLYGIGPTDPATYLGVTLLLGAIAWLASYIPAHQASKVDPMRTLRV
jgi:putative ABC transport system permease protein